MEKVTSKSLDFNGIELYLFNSGFAWYIAMEPVCRAVGLDYQSQLKLFKCFKSSYALTRKTTVDAHGKLRKMVYIQEKFFYFWLFVSRPSSEEKECLKFKCYGLLFDYLHG